MDVSEVLSDSEVTEKFFVLRSKGKFAAGGWQEDQPARMKRWGIVGLASAREIRMLPEADRVREVRTFFSRQTLFVTGAQRSGTSDMIEYKGELYRVFAVLPYFNRGYYKALATRLKGD